MQHRLTIKAGQKTTEGFADGNATILEALRVLGQAGPEAPCGGAGLCGKCRVLATGSLSAPDERERAVLSAVELASGIRLACRARIQGEVGIEMNEAGEASILSTGIAVEAKLDPPAFALSFKVPAPELETQTDDETRFLSCLESALAVRKGGSAPADRNGGADTRIGKPKLAILASLPGLLRKDGGLLTAVVAGNEVVSVRSGNGSSAQYGVGVDIGTTTVVCYLLDLLTGKRLGVRSGLNAQRGFGADVISRIQHTIEKPEGLSVLQGLVSGQISGLVRDLAADAGIDPADIASVCIAGNSTMLHLLAGVAPAAIASAPFIPGFTGRLTLRAAELGLDSTPNAAAILLPSVSGYVGADIVAGIMAVGMADRDERALFIDIGTNGEMAFGGKSGLLCCSTAAGPAFEGAVMERGSGGIGGAVDSVWVSGGSIGYSTIGSLPAIGLCGSGIIDALAAFLDLGLIDDTGRILDADEAGSLAPETAALRGESESGVRLYVDRERDLYLSQADVREAQLAKAAMAAGIDVLAKRAGVSLADIDRVYLAGGFGSFIDSASAVRIGLLPAEVGDRIVVAGNTSGAGAAACCLSAARLAECDRVRAACSYVELSASAEFNDAYIERMMFPEGKRVPEAT
jgi:uncharacterized 2Fe-2S/4Fe-4S cluster protein (DUF4445 family)